MSGPRARARPGDVSPDPPPFFDFKRRVVRRVSRRLGRGAKAPLAQRSRLIRMIVMSRAPRVGLAGADEALEALAGFIFGGEIAGAIEGQGACLGGKQALQLQRLLDAKR